MQLIKSPKSTSQPFDVNFKKEKKKRQYNLLKKKHFNVELSPVFGRIEIRLTKNHSMENLKVTWNVVNR